jgi:hypothetical protein
VQQLQVVEAAFAPDEVVADAGERDDVDPDGVVAGLLEVGRDEGGRDVGVEGEAERVIAVGPVHGAGSRIVGQVVEGAFVRDEGAEDVVLDEMEEVVQGEGKKKGLGVKS